MRHILIKLFFTCIAILLVARFLPGIEVTTVLGLIAAVAILALLNVFLKPLMIILTLPITVVTFGLFLFVINGLILYLTAAMVDGFAIANIWVAILASILISMVSTVINWLARGHR